MQILNVSLIFGMIVLGFYILFIGKVFFIPLVIGIVVWYLIYTLAGEYVKVRIGRYGMPRWAAFALSFVTMAMIVWFFVAILNSNTNALVEAAPSYQAKLQNIAQHAYNKLHLTETPSIQNLFASLDVSALLSSVAGMLTTVAGNMGMIVVYVLLLLLEAHTFDSKLKVLVQDKARYEDIRAVIYNINQDIRTYIKIKSVISLITGIFTYVVLAIVGVDFAVFWSLITFLFTYIPTIGAVVAVIFPALLTLVQFEPLYPFVIVTSLLIVVHLVIGNVLEPKMMGKSLNLSPLVIIISLAIWGHIWGITGMFLCVPIMVIASIIMSKFPSTRPIVIMLSEDGKIK
ncbi:MAG: AI-2E family transporter [Nitrospirae bacterium]|nr:AI-2E family transporter [Nitrospirota bacterium]